MQTINYHLRTLSSYRTPLLVLIALLMYLPSLRCGFMWDDTTHITENPVFKPSGLYRTWVGQDQPNYWPLTWTATWIICKIWGFNATAFHAVNILLHAVCTWLVFRVFQQLKIQSAWLAALLFAVHPVAVENVTWPSQLKSLLSSGFFLGSMTLYLSYIGSSKPARTALYAISLILFLAALLSKTSAVPLPPLLFVILWWKYGRSVAWKHVPGLVPFLFFAACQTVLEIWFQQFADATGPVRNITLSERTALIGWNISFYFEKALIPLNLSFIYPRFNVDTSRLDHWLPNICLCLVMGALAIATISSKSIRPVLAAFLSYVLLLIPVIGLADASFFRFTTVADHYQYLALPVVCAVISSVILMLKPRSIGFIAAGCVACAFVALSWQRQRLYKDEVNLWLDAAHKSPQAHLPHEVLGNLYYRRGRYHDAAKEFALAADLEPGRDELRRNLAQTLIRLNQYDKAQWLLQELVKKNPEHQVALCTLGDILLVQNRFESALEMYRKAERLNPVSAQIGNRIAQSYMSLGEFDKAEEQLLRVLKRHPKNVEANRNLRKTMEATTGTTNALVQPNSTGP